MTDTINMKDKIKIINRPTTTINHDCVVGGREGQVKPSVNLRSTAC